jgi:hypothetical protein
MPKSRNRKNHKAKVQLRNQKQELKRHNTQKFATQLQDLIKQHQEEELSKEMLTITQSYPNQGKIILPSTEIF